MYSILLLSGRLPYQTPTVYSSGFFSPARCSRFPTNTNTDAARSKASTGTWTFTVPRVLPTGALLE
jgi:hypothetical protein